MKINSNITAYITNNALKVNERNYSNSNRKLSSGYKINVAGDDPTGYAVSGRMKKMIRALERCSTNAVNGQSVCETADGALGEITNIIQRLNELSVKSANGVLTSDDRSYIENEAKELRKEIDKISKTTEFDGQPLFDGGFVNSGYTTNKDIKIVSYSEETIISSSVEIEISETVSGDNLTIKVERLPFFSADPAINVNFPKYYDDERKSTEGATIHEQTAVTTGMYTDANSNSVKIDVDGNQYITINGTNGESITFMVKADSDVLKYNGDTISHDGKNYYYQKPTFKAATFNINLTYDGAMRIQTGGNQNDYLDMSLPSMSTTMLDLDDLDLSTEAGATVGIGKVRYALSYVNEARSRIGAYQNRIEDTISFIAEATENLESSVSRIEDTDMAEEMTNFTNYQVLMQASTSMLAQANETPQMALQLLQ